jgi:hypothetical protein
LTAQIVVGQFVSWAATTAYVAGNQIVVQQYGSWEATTAYVQGAQIIVEKGDGTFWSFVSENAFTSGGSVPSWNFSIGAITVDGTPFYWWVCQGEVPSGTQAYGLFTVQTGGTSGATAPSWNFTVGSNTPDGSGSLVWTCISKSASNIQVYWLFTATVAGISGSTTPAWDFTTGTTTTDNAVSWLNAGQIAAALCAGIDGPSCLKMSDANNPNSWNPVNVAFIAKDDGTQITGIQPFTIAALGISPTGSLCVFKEYTTYQVIGVFGSTSFEIQPAQTNLGCIAARTIQFLPGFGVVRYSHLGFAVFDGINDRLISEDIRPYLFGGADSEADLTPVDPQYLYLSQSAQTVTPPMYLCAMPLLANSGALTRLFCYDLVMKAWAVLDLPWAITTLSTVAVGEGYPLILAGRTNGTIQRIQAGDLNWDQGAGDQTAVQWSFRSPEVFGEGGTQRLFYEQATITGYGSVAMVQSIIARLWLDGVQLGPQAIDIVPQGDSTFVARVSIFRNGQRAHLDVSGNNGGAGGVIDSIDWAVTPKSALARRIIS